MLHHPEAFKNIWLIRSEAQGCQKLSNIIFESLCESFLRKWLYEWMKTRLETEQIRLDGHWLKSFGKFKFCLFPASSFSMTLNLAVEKLFYKKIVPVSLNLRLWKFLVSWWSLKRFPSSLTAEPTPKVNCQLLPSLYPAARIWQSLANFILFDLQ